MAYTLVYDSGCGSCMLFKDAVELLDAKRAMEYIGLVDAESSGRLDAVDPALRQRSFHLISPNGRVWSGAGALPGLAVFLPGGRILSRALSDCPPAFASASFVYAALSRRHDSGSCGHPKKRNHDRKFE